MKHVVTQPTAPFATADGTLTVHQIPAWRDNLVWLLQCNETGAAAVVDGPEAGPVLAYCDAHGIELTAIFNTHTHGDHIGINLDLRKRGRLAGLRVVGAAARKDDVPGITEPVAEGDTVTLGAATGRVLSTEGHIDGHISFVFDDALFCGDTMFAAGCGYLFDGPAEKMHASLNKLAALPERTKVCCAHEYTEDNLRFAWSVDAGNPALAERIAAVWKLRGEGRCSVPSTIAEERATNPFLRFGADGVVQRLREAWPDRDLSTPAEVFAATRALKDRKDYKARGDEGLPLPG
ncbi:MAG: hydroxyacylglutathione hydrolase [Myxococcota bacterium]